MTGSVIGWGHGQANGTNVLLRANGCKYGRTQELS